MDVLLCRSLLHGESEGLLNNNLCHGVPKREGEEMILQYRNAYTVTINANKK